MSSQATTEFRRCTDIPAPSSHLLTHDRAIVIVLASRNIHINSFACGVIWCAFQGAGLHAQEAKVACHLPSHGGLW